MCQNSEVETKHRGSLNIHTVGMPASSIPMNDTNECTVEPNGPVEPDGQPSSANNTCFLQLFFRIIKDKSWIEKNESSVWQHYNQYFYLER